MSRRVSAILAPARSRSSAPAAGALGSTTPRLWTPPLRELTPATSYGFDVIRFADEVLEHPLDDWQEWAVIHGGELLDDDPDPAMCRPRFRIVLLEAARQNGKTEIPVVLTLYWQFVEAVGMVLGTSTKLDYAKESWTKAVRLAEASPALDGLRDARWKREANGEQESWTLEGARYKIAASNPEGGRSLTIDRLILDELRQHHTFGAWDAAVPAGNAVRHFQAWALTNAGDDRSVVLNDLRASALHYLETGDGDHRLGLFEWSAEEDADPLDVTALAQANPNLGRRIDPEALLADAARAVATGGEALTGFRTANVCSRVRLLDPAVDAVAWRACLELGDLSAVRKRVAACLDVAPDGQHATLAAAAPLADGRVRVEVVAAWSDTDELRRDLPGLVRRVRPRALGWFPAGPAAALAADLAERAGWPPAGVKVDELRGEVSAVCMGLAEQVKTGRIVHAGDPLLEAHVTGAERLKQGDGWRFSRKGDGHCDAAYAAAGAVHLARTLPAPLGKRGLIVVD